MQGDVKVYFNTKTFDALVQASQISATTAPAEAQLAVLGEKRIDYPAFVNLKAVYRFGVGSDNIDFEYLKSHNIPVHFPSERAREILYSGTADFTAYAILHFLHDGAFGNAEQWQKTQRDHIGRKTVLVIGVGNIGKRVVARLQTFVRVATYDALYNQPHELEPLMRSADVITVHLPLMAQTRNFFDREKLSWVKDGAIIVNTARGALFDEDALYEKLSSTRCRAFFDVFWKEPYEGKLKALGSDKFFITPHSASNTKEYIQAGFNDILQIIKQYEG